MLGRRVLSMPKMIAPSAAALAGSGTSTVKPGDVLNWKMKPDTVDKGVTPVTFSVNVALSPRNGLCTPLVMEGFAAS